VDINLHWWSLGDEALGSQRMRFLTDNCDNGFLGRMKKLLKSIHLLAIPIIFNSCATVGMLPQSASEVDFSSAEGKTGWSSYNQFETFRDTTATEIYDAVKVGLGDAGFSLRFADLQKGVVVGEHGMTMHDWNIIAGVYFREFESDTKVKVIVEGSKDIGFSGDVTSDGWAGKILRGTRQHLNRTKQAILKINRSDIPNLNSTTNNSQKIKPADQKQEARKRLIRLYATGEITREEYDQMMKEIR